MKLAQISIFLENRSGRMLEVCSLFGENDINIRALTVAETESFGVLRVVVDKYSKAVELLKNSGFTANITDVVAVEMPDKPGGLANVLKVIDDNDINVEYMYAFLEKTEDKAIVVFRFEEPTQAAEILNDNGISVVKDINE